MKKIDFSPNFSKKTEKKKDIKFVIFIIQECNLKLNHLERLKNLKSKVSCHYLINRKGFIFQLVKDKNIAWHAGKSKWKKNVNLNYSSIGIELVNKGHRYGYESFSRTN